jgi:DNA polymerase III alpha subunit
MLNNNNEIIVTENDLVEMMLLDITPHTVTMTNTATIDQYNHFCSLFLMDSSIDVETPEDGTDKYNKENDANWYMPAEYRGLSLWNYLMVRCDTQEQRDRVEQELEEYEKRGLYPLLRFMIYLVDTLRENDIVWGVGRGSSVASYVLYLIGVHRIDSIKYDLDYKEFFR